MTEISTTPSVNGTPVRPKLRDDHLELLRAEGVSDTTASEFCVSSEAKGFQGVAIRWYDTDESLTPYFYIPKPNRVSGGPKGLWDMGNKGRTTHPGWFRRPSGTKILVVEGTVQSLSAASWAPSGWGVVGIQGCRGLHKDVDLSWAFGMDVMLAFDADRNRNPDVRQAVDATLARLRAAGARTVTAWNIPETDGAKTGLDDLLKALPETDRTEALLDLEKGQTVLLRDPVKDILDKLLDSDGLEDIPDPEPLIKGWLTKDTLNRINGEPNSGKSLVALDWAACVGTGTAWMGSPVEQGTVLYVIAEGVRGFKKRKRAWEKQYGKKMTGVLFYPEPLQVVGRSYGDLGASREWSALREVCKSVRPSLVVLDTQRRVARDATENDNTEMGHVVDCLEDLRRDTGTCVLLVHHTPKGGDTGAGAGAVSAAVNSEFMMAKRGHGTDARFKLENTKEKDEADGADRHLRLEVHEVGYPDGDPFAPAVTSVVLVDDSEDEAGEPVRSRQDEWVAVMDEHGVPEGLPFRQVRPYLEARGVDCAGKKGPFEDAIRLRKARAELAAAGVSPVPRP